MSADKDKLREALDLLMAGGLAVGPDWEAAHEICQAREGIAAFDWIHALCHRIEGDDWNAGYWYRRAGRERYAGTVEEEWGAMRTALLAGD
ncbi:hypothetical protein [Oricola thermophila]|uniref:Uncharacterized protein n=1 Tax=Oricola thermophila TaxID=2742145 RepID=A0A6N1VBE9_9HYPH|nr:hypothetical protein [Oricola thermophila]QKV17998.1 hypothetical protein HTY61_05745 [Oricola thermophila]